MIPDTRQHLKAVFAIIGAMLSIQSGAALAKHLFQAIGPHGTAALRLLFGCMILCAVWRPWRKLPLRAAWPALLFYGSALGLMCFTFYLAIDRLPLGITVAIEFTGPLAVALLTSHRPQDIVWAACASAGIGLLLPFSGLSAPLDTLGIAYAFAAAFCWALYIVFGKKVSQAVHGGTATALGMCVAALLILPVGVEHAGATIFAFHLLPLGLAVAVFCSAIPFSLEMYALKRLPTRNFSILMSMEPAIATFIGMLLLSERLSVLQWLAIGLIVTASVGSTWSANAAEATSEIAP